MLGDGWQLAALQRQVCCPPCSGILTHQQVVGFAAKLAVGVAAVAEALPHYSVSGGATKAVGPRRAGRGLPEAAGLWPLCYKTLACSDASVWVGGRAC